jgi:transcriptional regulator with XRE-family HTH domain
MAVHESVEGLGDWLRDLRRQRGLALADVAAHTAVSASFLSQVENGRSDVSFGRLKRILDFYEVPIATLFETRATPDHEVVRREELAFLSADPGMKFAVVATLGSLRRIATLGIYAPGGSVLEHVRIEHDRLAFVARGQLTVTLKDREPVELSEGDSIYVRAGSEAMYANHGSTEAWLFGVDVPAPPA